MELEEKGRLLTLTLRRQRELRDGTFTSATKEVIWDPAQTAAILCDMWDRHWCRGASRRVEEMAPRMNEVVSRLRNKGALIIHAPSDTMKFYQRHPARLTAVNAPRLETDIPLLNWVKHDRRREGVFPIDDSDGGCGCEPKCKEGRPWSRQHQGIIIRDEDAIADHFEAVYLLKQRRIRNVMLMGVHTNMCVLGRPFGIRQLVAQGFQVVLVRDLTDTMYNPRMPPYVDHFRGTELVLEHIEKYWCPTITSDQIIGGAPFRFREDRR